MASTWIETQPIEWYLERADELAQKVVNAWGSNISFTDDLKALFDKAYRYLAVRGATLLFCVAEFISEIAMTPRPAES